MCTRRIRWPRSSLDPRVSWVTLRRSNPKWRWTIRTPWSTRPPTSQTSTWRVSARPGTDVPSDVGVVAVGGARRRATPSRGRPSVRRTTSRRRRPSPPPRSPVLGACPARVAPQGRGRSMAPRKSGDVVGRSEDTGALVDELGQRAPREAATGVPHARGLGDDETERLLPHRGDDRNAASADDLGHLGERPVTQVLDAAPRRGRCAPRSTPSSWIGTEQSQWHPRPPGGVDGEVRAPSRARDDRSRRRRTARTLRQRVEVDAVRDDPTDRDAGPRRGVGLGHRHQLAAGCAVAPASRGPTPATASAGCAACPSPPTAAASCTRTAGGARR